MVNLNPPNAVLTSWSYNALAKCLARRLTGRALTKTDIIQVECVLTNRRLGGRTPADTHNVDAVITSVARAAPAPEPDRGPPGPRCFHRSRRTTRTTSAPSLLLLLALHQLPSRTQLRLVASMFIAH
jgi:hypothetical protein